MTGGGQPTTQHPLLHFRRTITHRGASVTPPPPSPPPQRYNLVQHKTLHCTGGLSLVICTNRKATVWCAKYKVQQWVTFWCRRSYRDYSSASCLCGAPRGPLASMPRCHCGGGGNTGNTNTRICRLNLETPSSVMDSR